LHPSTGLGKPEVLKYELTGLWSCEIDKKNRLIYEIEDNRIHIISMLGHYSDK
jgi:toxin YoeB